MIRLIHPHDVNSPAHLYLCHLARATRKLREREEARNKLASELAALKRISTPSLHKHLKKLEKSINKTLRLEKTILTKQKKEETLHEKIQRVLAVKSSVHERQTGILETEASLQRLERAYQADMTPAHKNAINQLKRRVHKLKH